MDVLGAGRSIRNLKLDERRNKGNKDQDSSDGDKTKRSTGRVPEDLYADARDEET